MSSVLRAESPQTIGLADGALTNRFAFAAKPGVRLVILNVCGDEDVSQINQRALAMQSARWFVYESNNEPPLQAMYRERLMQHGVVSVDVASQSRRLDVKGRNISQCLWSSLITLSPATP